MLSKAAYDLGYAVHVLAPKFPAYECRYAIEWSRVNAVDNVDGAISLAKNIKPVSYTHLTLPTNREV